MSAARDGSGVTAATALPDQGVGDMAAWTPNAALAALPLETTDAHRRGMRHIASSVFIITARAGERRAGLTATAVCSVTVDPPRLVAFVNKTVQGDAMIRDSGAVCINVLAAAQEPVAKAFAGMIPGVQGEARFGHGQWSAMVTGAPALDGALANFDCRVIKVFDESTHHAFVAEVLATRVGPTGGDALIYLNGAFRSLAG